jgi:hypothetical protein
MDEKRCKDIDSWTPEEKQQAAQALGQFVHNKQS